ncbi:MAG: hypothetical protein L0Y44_12910 [Phycisphaerales bacterium]|nr:hypothetical protein [Phycisphaerales bacterium]
MDVFEELLAMADPLRAIDVGKRAIVRGAVEAARVDYSRTVHERARAIASLFDVDAGVIERALTPHR